MPSSVWFGQAYIICSYIKAAPGCQKSCPSYKFNSLNFDSEKISVTTPWDHLKGNMWVYSLGIALSANHRGIEDFPSTHSFHHFKKPAWLITFYLKREKSEMWNLYCVFQSVCCNLHWQLPADFWALFRGLLNYKDFLPPTLAEKVIFSVASVCVSVCVSVCLRSAGWTDGPTD